MGPDRLNPHPVRMGAIAGRRSNCASSDFPAGKSEAPASRRTEFAGGRNAHNRSCAAPCTGVLWLQPLQIRIYLLPPLLFSLADSPEPPKPSASSRVRSSPRGRSPELIRRSIHRHVLRRACFARRAITVPPRYCSHADRVRIHMCRHVQDSVRGGKQGRRRSVRSAAMQ